MQTAVIYSLKGKICAFLGRKKKFYFSYVSTYIPINYFFQAGRNIPCLKHNTNYTHIHKLKPFIIFASIEITSFTSGFLLGIWIIIGCLCICRIKKVIKKLQKTVKARLKQEVARAFKKWRGNLDTYMTQVFLPSFFSSILPLLPKCFMSE